MGEERELHRHGAGQLLYFFSFYPHDKPRSKVVITHFTSEKTEAYLPRVTQLVGSGAENNFLIQKPMLFPLWEGEGSVGSRDFKTLDKYKKYN